VITLQERVHAAPKPVDWQLDKLHHVFRVRRGNKNRGMKEENLLSLSYGRIIQKDIETAEGLLPENFEGYQIVEPGDIVLRLTDLQNDKRSLRQGLVTQRGIVTSAYDAVEVQRDNDPRFWFYSLLALDLAKHYYSLGGGVRQSVKFADFPNDWVYRPDLATQRQIADFLDRETARIDLLIEKKQRLAALLAEKKSASIDQIVNSQEWSEVKLSRLVRMIDGDRSSEYPSDQDFVDEGIPFISSKQIQDRVLTLDDAKFITPEKFAKLGRGKLQDGDIIVTVRGTLGNTAIFQKELATTGFINAQIMIMRPENRVDPFLLHMFTQSTAWSDQIAVEGYGSAQKQLNQDVLRRFTARYPLDTNPDRWQQIMSDLVAQHSMIGTKTNASIDRLKEYRSALITAAVTGQIDVTTYVKSGTSDPALCAIQEEMGV